MKQSTTTYLYCKAFVILIGSITLLSFIGTTSVQNENVIQIRLDQQLNARSVTTLTGGKLTTWTKGIDGDGAADGYLTLSASLFIGDKNPNALPDNPLIPANNQHPEVLLHYSNTDSTSNQTIALNGIDSLYFEVPSKQYSKLFLAVTSAEGPSHIIVDLYYSDGMESKSFEVPDYYADIQANDPNVCYLLHDLAKWGKTNNMTEKDHHNIDLLDIHPDPNRILTKVRLKKSEAAYLVLWAATGVTAK